MRNKHNFDSAISTLDWKCIYDETDMQNAFTTFHGVLLKLYNTHFPKQKVKYAYNTRKPWLSHGLREAIKKKNKLFLKYRKTNSVQNETNYKIYRNKLNHILKISEKKHFQELLNSSKDNMKKTWQIMKNIVNKGKSKQIQSKFKLSDGTVTTNKDVISSKFNDFFVNIGPTLAKKIPNQTLSPLHFMGNPMINSIFLTQVTPVEMTDILQSLKNGAAGYDDINASLLKMVSSCIVLPLVYLCNLSLDQGIFPDELKVANIVPLYKADDPFMFNNYRPVSLLSVLSKVFERVMYNRLMEYLDVYKILVSCQFGFRKLHSSCMALMALMDKLISSLENKEFVIGIFLDFSKAFDNVDHDILLCKLSHYGIRGNALKWIESYLSNRKQFVTYNGVSSVSKAIVCGVPQGSVLGPLLFLIYINDLCAVCKNTTPILFADDTNLFSSGTDLQLLESQINEDLVQISLWLKVNKLSLNIKKTHYMVFTRSKIRNIQLAINIDDESIDEVRSTKFLGVVIDNKLNWKDHIMHIAGKISRGIGMIIKARDYLNKDGLLALYNAFIYPYITYCNHIWGATYKSNLTRLVTLQNKIVRIICHVKPRESYKPCYQSLGILPFDMINHHLIGCFMYRFCIGKVPFLFDSFFIKNSELYNYNTRTADHLHVPIVKSDLGKTGIRYRGVIVWNEILKDGVDPDVSEAVFKKYWNLW